MSGGESQDASSQGLGTITYNLKAYQVIFKAVFGTAQVERENVVKVLKKKFTVKQERLTSLTMTQLMEVLAKKLVNQKYCSIRPDKRCKLKKGRLHSAQRNCTLEYFVLQKTFH